jgi:pimeloyl-ACP methyl ester carboxylesterase
MRPSPTPFIINYLVYMLLPFMVVAGLLFAKPLPQPVKPLVVYKAQIDSIECAAFGFEMDSAKPLLLLVHGSPGDHSAWNSYLQDTALQKKYRLLAIDRPGYGDSDSSHAYPDLGFQAKVVHLFIAQYAHHQPVVLLSHSLGGPIVARCAIDYPTDAQHLILLAPAIAAQYEQPRWYNKLAKKDWIQRKLPPEMRISQAEMMPLPAQLDAMEPLLHTIAAQVWLYHGKLDMVAPYGNALYLQKHIIADKLHFTAYSYQNHFLPWTKFKDIQQLLLRLNI